MPCRGPSADEIASMQARDNEYVHSLLRRLSGKAPPAQVAAMPLRQLWWNNGKPEHASKDTLDHHTEMLCELCTRLDNPHDRHLIESTNGLRAWWDEHLRLDAEREALEKAAKAKTKAEKVLVKKLKAAGITPEEVKEFGFRSLKGLLA